MLVMLILMFMLAGVVEFGFVMNNYLHLFDAAREAARFGSDQKMFDPETGMTNIDAFDKVAVQALRVMVPVVPIGNNDDDVILSVFAASGSNVDRYPDSNGWSLCANHLDAEVINGLPIEIPEPDFINDWEFCTPQDSRFTDAEIEALLDPAAPPAGLLLVEIIYHQFQILNLPLFSEVANPMTLSVHSVMPNQWAEPTATPP
jgi:hypothetical protein